MQVLVESRYVGVEANTTIGLMRAPYRGTIPTPARHHGPQFSCTQGCVAPGRAISMVSAAASSGSRLQNSQGAGPPPRAQASVGAWVGFAGDNAGPPHAIASPRAGVHLEPGVVRWRELAKRCVMCGSHGMGIPSYLHDDVLQAVKKIARPSSHRPHPAGAGSHPGA